MSITRPGSSAPTPHVLAAWTSSTPFLANYPSKRRGWLDSIITLTGDVRTWAEHDAVVGAAWVAARVIDVRDDLQVAG